LALEPWVDRVEIVEVWDPPWTNERITAEGRAKLKEFGVGV
jgi:metal-sulfur cluster biosynthetic enzyme